MTPTASTQAPLRGSTRTAPSRLGAVRRSLTLIPPALVTMALTSALAVGVAPAHAVPASPQVPATHLQTAEKPSTSTYDIAHPPVPMHERMVTSKDGTRIAVQEYGKKRGTAPTLLMIHGYPNTHAVFYKMLPSLVGKYHIVTFDERGAGKSDHPMDTKKYDLTRVAEDFIAITDATAKGEKVHVIGHDFGALVGWDLLARHWTRPRIASFTTFGAPAFEHWAYWMRERTNLKDQPFGALDFASQMIRIPEFWAFLVPGVPEAAWATGMFEATVHYFNNVSHEPREAHFSARDGYFTSKLYTQNYGDRTMKPRWKYLKDLPPIMSLEGSQDRFFTRDFTNSMDTYVPGIKHVQFPAGHWGLVTIPRTVAGQIDSFVAGAK